MSEFTWPDEAIDAAAKALMEDSARTWDEAWDELPKAARKEWRRYATGALSALTPFVSAMLDEAKAERSLPRHDPPDLRYDLRLRLNRAMRWLREAEDLARVEMPAWPTADRIRDIYEQVGEDVLNGKTSVPPIRQRLAAADAAGRRLAEALREIRDHGKTDEFPCHDFAGGADCVDLMQERARAALAECPWKGKPDA